MPEGHGFIKDSPYIEEANRVVPFIRVYESRFEGDPTIAFINRPVTARQRIKLTFKSISLLFVMFMIFQSTSIIMFLVEKFLRRLSEYWLLKNMAWLVHRRGIK